MELKKFEIDGREVEFVNQWRGNRSGFVHETTLFIDGRRVAEAKCQYYNRTWESYTYQTVMKKAAYQLIEEETEYLREKFMQEHGYKKLTANRKAEFEEVCRENKALAFNNAIYAKL